MKTGYCTGIDGKPVAINLSMIEAVIDPEKKVDNQTITVFRMVSGKSYSVILEYRDAVKMFKQGNR